MKKIEKLEMIDISKSFQDIPANNNLNLSIQPVAVPQQIAAKSALTDRCQN